MVGTRPGRGAESGTPTTPSPLSYPQSLMAISSGRRIGSYEIVSRLGAGGMGEVWRARDTAIQRDVAIKFLLEEMTEGTADVERLARFEQEAQAAGALNHPNILTVFELGRHEGRPYLVTELLEGESLREKLGDTGAGATVGRALPARKALELGAQIATGLAAAHEKGIVHRDLKPENLFVTSDGRVKILDFGLAKLAAPADAESLPNAPTAYQQTSPGTVMGTVGYMAPEQVRGQSADARADIFACGAVLYEMLSGGRAFRGSSPADTISAILKEDPPELSETQPRVPLPIERIVRRCLEKEPSQRFQSARDLAFALEAVAGSSTTSGPLAGVETSGGERRSRHALVRTVAALVAVLALAAAYYAGRARTAATPGAAAAAIFDSAKFTPLTFRPLIVFEAAFAPGQHTVVFSAAEEGSVPSIYTVSPDYPEPRDAGLPGVHLLAISSQGEMAVLTNPRFMSHRQFEGTLARVPVGGNAPREILEAVRQAAWSPDGRELAILRTVDGLDRLEYPIGKVLHTTAGYLSDLKVSPNNDHIAFFEHPQKWDDRGPLRVVDLAGEVTTLGDGYWGSEGVAWAPDGKSIVYSASDTGADYALRSVDLAGNSRIVRRDSEGLVIHEVGEDGRWLVSKYRIGFELWARAAGMERERNLSWLDSSISPSLSPDGEMLLFDEESSHVGANYATCLRKTPDSPVVMLGEGRPRDLSRDGKWALVHIYDTPQRLVAYPTGAGEAKELDPGGLGNYQNAAWLPDGKRFLLCGWKTGDAGRCYVKPIEGGTAEPVTPEGLYVDALVSRDGTRVLVRDDAGHGRIFPFDGGDPVEAKGLTAEDQWIRWSADDRSLLVFRGNEIPVRVERVDIATGVRRVVLTIEPANRSSLLTIPYVTLADDEKHYAYSAWRTRTQLFTIEGLR